MSELPLWLTAESACGYFSDRQSQSIVVHPRFDMDTSIYAQLLRYGFRRSGNQVYRPHCRNCSACVPTRIPVAEFQADRKQRRCLKRNADTRVVINTAEFNERHFDLYRRYQTARHDRENGGNIGRDDYLHFLSSDWCNTWFVEFLIQDRLAAVAVVDALDDALSAVYTFFDPTFNEYSPGTFAVLWQIEEARRRQMQFVYLGFWISDCRKMRYKIEYQPLQGLIDEQWQPIHQHSTNED